MSIMKNAKRSISLDVVETETDFAPLRTASPYVMGLQRTGGVSAEFS